MSSAVDIPASGASAMNPVSSISSTIVTNFTMDRSKLAGRLYTMAKSDLPDFSVELKNANGQIKVGKIKFNVLADTLEFLISIGLCLLILGVFSRVYSLI